MNIRCRSSGRTRRGGGTRDRKLVGKLQSAVLRANNDGLARNTLNRWEGYAVVGWGLLTWPL